MGKQILNRREAIYAEDIPPEIADTSGFIEATDYATDTTGGTVKVDGDYGVELTNAGFLRGTVETTAAYAEASNNLLVSKGTLDAVLAAQPAPQGFTETALFSGNSSLTTAQALSDKISGYKLLVCVFSDEYSELFTVAVPVATVTLGTTKFNGCIGTSYLINFSFQSGESVDSLQKESGTGTVTLKAVYGYK